MSHSFSNILYHRHGLQAGYFLVLCLLWQLRVILYCLGKILTLAYYLPHLLLFRERQNEYNSYQLLFLKKAEKKKRNKKEEKEKADISNQNKKCLWFFWLYLPL